MPSNHQLEATHWIKILPKKKIRTSWIFYQESPFIVRILLQL
ncbi:hypothetical protein [Priestia megaterium]